MPVVQTAPTCPGPASGSPGLHPQRPSV